MFEPKDGAVDRKTLYAEVWTDPMTVVAERYGLSDVGFAKLCRRYAIPVPSRGYWAKVKAGRIMGRPPLPALPPSVPTTTPLRPLSTEQRIKRTAARSTMKRIKESHPKIEAPADLLAPHPLVRDASKRLRLRDGWTSASGLRSAPNEVLHLEVSRASLDRALRLVDTLIKALDVSDVTVHVDSQHSETFLESGGTKVPLVITEKITWTEHTPTRAELRAKKRYDNSYLTGEKVEYPHIPQFDPQPNGRLTITVGHKYGARNWNDTERKRLEERMGEVVAGIITFIECKRAEETERLRREEARRLAREKYEREVERRENEYRRLRALQRDAARFRRAQQIREYLNAYELAARDAGTLTPEIEEWLAWSRAKADWIDPLVPMSDLILGVSEFLCVRHTMTRRSQYAEQTKGGQPGRSSA